MPGTAGGERCGEETTRDHLQEDASLHYGSSLSFSSAASSNPRISASRSRRASAFRWRLRVARHRDEHASRWRPTNGPPHSLQSARADSTGTWGVEVGEPWRQGQRRREVRVGLPNGLRSVMRTPRKRSSASNAGRTGDGGVDAIYDSLRFHRRCCRPTLAKCSLLAATASASSAWRAFAARACAAASIFAMHCSLASSSVFILAEGGALAMPSKSVRPRSTIRSGLFGRRSTNDTSCCRRCGSAMCGRVSQTHCALASEEVVHAVGDEVYELLRSTKYV